MDNQNNIQTSQTSESLKQYSVIVINGKNKIYINNKFSGEDKRKEAADVILGNKRI